MVLADLRTLQLLPAALPLDLSDSSSEAGGGEEGRGGREGGGLTQTGDVGLPTRGSYDALGGATRNVVVNLSSC